MMDLKNVLDNLWKTIGNKKTPGGISSSITALLLYYTNLFSWFVNYPISNSIFKILFDLTLQHLCYIIITLGFLKKREENYYICVTRDGYLFANPVININNGVKNPTLNPPIWLDLQHLYDIITLGFLKKKRVENYYTCVTNPAINNRGKYDYW